MFVEVRGVFMELVFFLFGFWGLNLVLCVWYIICRVFLVSYFLWMFDFKSLDIGFNFKELLLWSFLSYLIIKRYGSEWNIEKED